ncbi:MAG: LytTR family DNA-binding domain-containing protein [Syntrophomonadaceae bacterium]
MNVLIVDDDQPTGLYLEHIVSKTPGVNVLAALTSGEEAIRFAQAHKPDVVFLDIDMPGMSGLEVARVLADLYSDIVLIFATAYPGYTLEAFEVYGYDYILKPFDEERIRKTLTRLAASLPGQLLTGQPEAIPVHCYGKTVLLQPDEIMYVESSQAKVLIKTAREQYNVKGTLADWVQRLERFGFVPSHRSYLVNLNKVDEISRHGFTYNLRLSSGDSVPLSRNHAKGVKKLLGH